MRPEDDRAFRVLHDETEPLMRRLDAVSRLAAAEDPAVVVPLAALCGEAGGPLRDALLRAVGKLDARAVLTRSLAGADGERRRTIARLLGGIGERAACPALVDLMQDDPDPRVREEAAGALARLCDPSTLAPLLRRLEEDSDRYVRAAAAQALGEIGGEAAARALEQARGREEHPSVRMLIEDAVARLRSKSASEPSRSPSEAKRAASCVKGVLALLAFAAAILGVDLRARAQVDAGDGGGPADAGRPAASPPAGGVANRSAVKRLLLIATGHDRPLGERGQAIEELGRLGDPTVVMPLIDGVLGCVCGAGRPLFQGIQRALVRLDARTVFLAGLDASDPQVRADTLDRIMYFPDRGLAPRCLQMLSDPNPRMREKAAAALASVGDESHVEVLGQRLDDDPDAFVRMAAAEALGAIAGPRAIEILRGGAARESHPIGQRTIEEAIERATRRTARRQGTRRR